MKTQSEDLGVGLTAAPSALLYRKARTEVFRCFLPLARAPSKTCWKTLLTIEPVIALFLVQVGSDGSDDQCTIGPGTKEGGTRKHEQDMQLRQRCKDGHSLRRDCGLSLNFSF